MNELKEMKRTEEILDEDSCGKQELLPPQSFSPHSSERENDILEEEPASKEKAEFGKMATSGHTKLKNGCCKECMKAFSKNGKSCLCQVPRLQRRTSLPPSGCRFCGCHGCNPIDLRTDKRAEIKKKLKDEGTHSTKRSRLLDSDKDELLLKNQYDNWNHSRFDLGEFMAQILSSNMGFLGFGIPLRTQSYILGAKQRWVNEPPSDL